MLRARIGGLRAAIERRAKVRLHLDLVESPSAHAWTLSLYRAGEQYPEHVADYFPHEVLAQGHPELARRMRRHAGEERGHVVLYTRAIERMGEPIFEARGLDVFNESIRQQTTASWAIRPGAGYQESRLCIAHFLAHAHRLEARVERSLGFHLEACERAGRDEAASVVARVLADEARHVRETRETLEEITTAKEREAVIEAHARGEARANASFSSRQLRSFSARYASHLSARRRRFYAASAFVMELARA